jgi:hypothetical protein
MAEAMDAYEHILALCRDEMASIRDRDTERLCSVLREREEAVDRFMKDDVSAQDRDFLNKLEKIRAINAKLSSEARLLHQSLKEELLRLRQENRRISGYRSGAMVTPLSDRRMISRKG